MKNLSKLLFIGCLLFTFFIPYQCKTLDENLVESCQEGTIPPNLESVRSYLDTIDFSNSNKWFLFPTQNGIADSLKRLGLPVHGRWVTTWVNRTANDYIKEFEYLVGNDRAATKRLTPSGPQTGGSLDQIVFPDNRDDHAWGEGAIEIKSAWKKLCIGKNCGYADAQSLEEARKKFLIRDLMIYDEVNDSCYRDTMALIGLRWSNPANEQSFMYGMPRISRG